MTELGAGVHAAIEAARPLSDAFARAGHRIYLVGGIVRDDVIGRRRADADFDLTTDARPEQIKALVAPLAQAVWSQGERFGTIGCQIGGQDYEITTHRADTYDPDSRKPIVEFGDNVHDDLARRDFTVNAMAVDLHDGSLVDPFEGAPDLAARRLRTPLDPEISFSDDPLRMLRAARFIATLGLVPDPALTESVVSMRERMAIVSVERIRDELDKMMALANPQPGFAFLSSTGLLANVVPGVAAAGLADDVVGARVERVNRAIEGADLRPARWAALLLDAPTDQQADTLAALKPSRDLLDATRGLLTAAAWDVIQVPVDAPALRRAAVAAPNASSLDAQFAFVAAVDETRADLVGSAAAALAALRDEEPDLDDPRPPLTGGEVAALLGVEPGPVIGTAHNVLREHRFDHGPMSPDDARRVLTEWWADQV